MSRTRAPRRAPSRGPTRGSGRTWAQRSADNARARADRSAQRNRRAEENRKARERIGRRLMFFAHLELALTLLTVRGGWSGGRAVVRHTRTAWRRTGRHVTGPAWRLTRRRLVDPARARVRHGWENTRDRAQTWAEDVRAFGLGARARDCDHCDDRVPSHAWQGHQWDEHGADVPEPRSPLRDRARDLVGGAGTHRPDRDRARPYRTAAPAVDGHADGFEWNRTPGGLLAGLTPSALRDRWNARRHRSWVVTCTCGWSGSAEQHEQHLPGCTDTAQARSRRPADPTPIRPIVVPSVIDTAPGRTPAMSSPNTPAAVAGAEEIAYAPETLQVHDLPPLFRAGADHARAEATVLMLAQQRAAAAEGSDHSVSYELGRAYTAQMGVAGTLDEAARHASLIADRTPDYRDARAAGAVEVEVYGNNRQGRARGIARGTGEIMSMPALQIHDVPPLLQAAGLHVRAEVESLVAAFGRLQAAEGTDRTISTALSTAVTLQLEVRAAFERAQAAASRLADAAPDFRGRRAGAA